MIKYAVLVTPAAQKAIINLGQYIYDQFKNPTAARKTMLSINKRLEKLSFSADNFPFVDARFDWPEVTHRYQYFLP
ncbi:hypothetical protein PT274_00665 [Leuconostocaceae bacterium ESL0958]|nr:hypothetical protein [Leuconostocaceae bacterium ESL0958]